MAECRVCEKKAILDEDGLCRKCVDEMEEAISKEDYNSDFDDEGDQLFN